VSSRPSDPSRTRAVRVAAPAKINLGLRVLDRRPDGYHDLRTVFQAIDLSDEVSVQTGGEGIELAEVGPSPGPADENLAVRAARAYRDATGFAEGVHISLHKRIPPGAGLGGGSSDAAAVLKCLALLAGDRDGERLDALGADLGSDVPFFLGSGARALGTGRGEILRPLTPLPERHVLLVLPPVHVSTAEAYRRLDTARASSDEGEGAVRGAISVDAAAAGDPRDWAAVDSGAHNDFEPVIVPVHPEIARSLAALREAGATAVSMSGSGSASFGLFEESERASSAAARLSGALGWPCVLARTLQTMPVPITVPTHADAS
jgi:4-diphosphocytidyl-2-C-methyl-D-erythritol kinase